MPKIEKKNIEDILGLIPMQEGMLYHYLKEPGSNLYFEQLCLDISGEIDVERFENAWNFVIRTNEMLRTVFRWEGLENPMQMVLKEHRLCPHYYDFSSQDTEELKTGDRNNSFDLTGVPFRVYLCKTGSAAFEMIVSYHHILYDGWSNGIILEEFLTAYHDLCAGKELKIPVKTKFKEFVAWLQNADRSKEDTYWENYLYGFDTPTELSIKKRNKGERITAANFQTRFNKHKPIKEKIEGFVKTQKITAASLFYCSWGILLQRYNNNEDVVFGTTVSGRPAGIQGIERMVGLFINTIPLRIRSFPGEKIADLLHRITGALEEREPYENTPLVEIKKLSMPRCESEGKEFFDSLVVIENYPMDSRRNREKNELIINSYSMVEATHYDLTLGIMFFDDIEINFSYREQAFEVEDIEGLAGHFFRILQDILDDPGKELSRIEMLSAEEKHRLLYEWNNTETPYPQDKTIHGLFAEQVERTPDNIALSVRLVGLSYRQLNEQSNGLARLLGEKGVGPDTIAAIMTERSVEMIIGILGILMSGGAYLPIDPEYPQERIRYMLADSNARILLGMEECQKKIIVNCQFLIVNCKPPMGSRSRLLTQAPFHHSSFIAHHSNQLSYLIYTSGTTGRPKGVVVEHRAAVNTLVCRKEEYRLTVRHTSLQLFSYAFDGFITSFFTPVISGARVVLLDESEVKDIQQIKAVVVRHNVTHFICVPALYQAIIESLTPGEAASLQVVTLAGDVLSPGLLEITRQKNPNLEIVNEYGVSEVAVMSTIYRRQEKAGRIVIGRPIWNTHVYIVDHQSRPQPVSVPGELCIAGSGLARGYLNNPELTAEKYNRSYRTNRTYILYKTGDLARWLANGNIEFLGRIDQQVKIRGFRLELEEIERRLTGHDRVKEAVVLAKKGPGGDNYLCAYVVPAADLEEPGLRDFLAKELPAYMIPTYFVFLETIPLTINGKVDRRALPEPEFIVCESYAPPQNEMEERLVKLWSEILASAPSTPTGRPGIGIDDNFFKLGGHSLKAARLVLKIHKELNVKIPMNALFENPTIRELARFIKSAKQDMYIPIEEVEKREYYPLSAAQKRLFITQYMESGGLGYNVQNLVQLEGKLSPQGRERLEDTFLQLIHRHESLRTSFEIIADEPVQRIHKEVEFKLGVRDQGSGGIKSFVRPFDLSKAPLLRVGLIKTGEEIHILIIDMHHIIADALSMTNFIKEFTALYRGEELPPLLIQYKDFTLWRNEILRNPVEKGILEKQEGYWLKEFEGDIPPLNLPLDFDRPTIRQYEGASVFFELAKDKAVLLKKLAAAEDVTLFMLFLSLFNVLLAKICYQEDISVGTPIAGRKHPDLQQVMGLFINMLALRNRPTGDKSSRYFLKEVKQKTLAAFENQDYPYEELVDKAALKTKRDPSRNALFDVLFVWEDLDIRLDYLTPPGNEREEERLSLKSLKVEKINAPFDLILTGAESTETMSFFINYSTALFKRESIEKMIGNFKEVISQVLNNPNIKLADIDILPEEEKKKILLDFNDTEGEYPEGKTIQQWFVEQAAMTPDSIAISVREVRQVRQVGRVGLSYRQLNEKSGRLAGVLSRKGVESDVIVALMVERSPEMIIGLLGILKAGGAYLPLDTSYPEERKRYMLTDSRVQLMITDRVNRAPGCAPVGVEIIDVTDPQVYCGDGNNLPGHVGSAGDLVYLIYTSGSTGNPKGVMLEHRNVVNLIYFDFHYTNMDFSKVLQFHTIGFDASFHEIFCALLSGGELCLIDEDTRLDIPGLFRVVEENRVPTVFLPMSFLRIIFNDCHYVREFPRCVRHIQTAGEQVFINRLFRGFLQENHVYLHNHYGPSETHVVTALTLDPDGDIPELPSIGKPILNSSIYILDKEQHLLPVGAPGEMYIGGIQVGRGYLFQSELTAEKFIKNRSYRTNRTNITFYKTGDLARWLADGNIEFLGRIDTQVKIRGFRIEPGEIESKLTDIDYIKEAVVIDRVDGNGEKYLCAYVVSDVDINPGELRGILSKTLPDYMIPSYFMRLEQIPLSPNGKVKRDALPSIDTAKLKKIYVAPPRDEVERELCRLWGEVLGLEKDSIGIDDNFFELGGHSLKATILITKMHKAFNVKLILGELFNRPTVKGLAQLLKRAPGETSRSIEPVEKKEYYPMSSSQKRMYIINQLERDSISYNMPAPMIIEGNVDKEKLAGVFRELTRRQEGLRTAFVVVGGEPVQKIEEIVEFKLEYDNAAAKNAKDREEKQIMMNFVRPFDLSCAPLFRVGLARLEEEKYLFIVDFHHIIGDGVSLGVMVREFTQLYEGRDIPPLPVQYKDYAVWQQAMAESGAFKRQEEYWLNRMSADIAPLDLPLDYPRPAMMSFEGRWVEFEIPAATAGKLKKLAELHDATLYMVLLAAYNVLLHKYTGRDTIVVGSAIAGRSHPDLENIVGVFLNTLAMKNNPSDSLTFAQFLGEVRENALRAYENQDFQFEELVEKLNLKRDYSRNPIFDTMLNFINMDIPEVKLRDLKLTPYKMEGAAVKFDFKINAWEQDDMVRFTLDYCTKLFKPETMDSFIENFLKIIDKINETPDIKIAEISLISKKVEKEMIEDFNEEITTEF